jgi:hypothetical protein
MDEYERMAVDGEGDAWGYQCGQWRCLTAPASCRDDEALARVYGGAVFYSREAVA